MTWKRSAFIIAAILAIAFSPSIVRAIRPFLTVAVQYQAVDGGRFQAGCQDMQPCEFVDNSTKQLMYTDGTTAASNCCGGGGGGTFATTYSTTASDNRVTVTSAGGPLLLEPSSSAQGVVLAAKNSSAASLLSVADNAAAYSSTNTGVTLDTKTALTAGRHYFEAANGGVPQWCAWTSGSSAVSLEACAGSTSQFVGNNSLVVMNAQAQANYLSLDTSDATLVSTTGNATVSASTGSVELVSSQADGANVYAAFVGTNSTWSNDTA